MIIFINDLELEAAAVEDFPSEKRSRWLQGCPGAMQGLPSLRVRALMDSTGQAGAFCPLQSDTRETFKSA